MFKQGDWEFALRDLPRLHETDPANAVVRLMVDCYYNLGVLDLQREDPRSAADSSEAINSPHKTPGAPPGELRQRLPRAPAGPVVSRLREVPGFALRWPASGPTPSRVPALFDLPLVEPERAAREAGAARVAGRYARGPAALPRSVERVAIRAGARAAGAPGRRAAAPGAEVSRPRAVPPALEPPPAGLAPRLAAALADLLVHFAVGLILAAGSRLLGVEGLPPWPPIALCLALFSFVYFVVPLAFWGSTPGMAWRGLRARPRGGEPLSFGQATRRWLGSLVSAALAGLPALLALGGRSFTDLVSGSVVRRER
jgi:uncharacterized RDD family membrane protein YckC